MTGGTARPASGDPLLMSKIIAPGVPRWLVPRSRLDKLITQGARNPITTVTGPPGAGKTMGLALWAADADRAGPIAWVTIDDYDNRPRVFWSYVLAALRSAGVPIPRTASASVRRNAVDHEFLLRFASLMARRDPPVTLVIDDAHLLTAPKILDGLAYVLRHAGPGMHLVVSSRMDPPLPLHRYRLSGELTEIRASDLAFTIPEARLVMAQHGVALSAESLERLTRRAEGWVAVMRLAAISMAAHPDPEQFVKELIAEDSAVAGFLVEEVLNAQPGRMRDFLLRTSILHRINGTLAGELTGGGREAADLPELARANPLVQRDEAGWYRYHPLFAEVLRLKLRRECPDEVPDLHLRAAGWFRRNGLLVEAVQHAADAGDWQLAARTVLDELVIDEFIDPPGREHLASRFRQMPRDLKWMAPQPLLVAAAIDFARGHDAASEALLGAAERMLGPLPPRDDIPARLAASLIRAALSRRAGNLDGAALAMGAAQVLVETLPRGHLAKRKGIHAHVLAGRGAVELWSGHFDEASAIFEAGAVVERAQERGSERSDCLGHLALIEALRGRLGRAAELAAEATSRPEEEVDPRLGPTSAAAEVALAAVHLERNERRRARRWLKRAEESLRARPDKVTSAVACLVAARHSLADGYGRAALEILDQAQRGWSPPAWIEHRLTLLRSDACAATGDVASATDLAGQAGPGSSLDAAVTLARALLTAGDLPAARRALADTPSAGEDPDGVWLAASLLDAQLSYCSGDHSRGRRSLENALRLGEPQHRRLPFAMERSWLRPVVRRGPELPLNYRRLLEPDVVSPDADRGAVGVDPGAGQMVPLIVEPLSEREREVLEHVSAMETTAEIACGMYISMNTVKTHLKSIYRKLAVTHRGEAVRRARELGLL